MTGGIDKQNQLLVIVGQHSDKVFALFQAGFFDMKNGSIECFFDMNGKLRKIDKHVSFQVVDTG